MSYEMSTPSVGSSLGVIKKPSNEMPSAVPLMPKFRLCSISESIAFSEESRMPPDGSKIK